MKPNKFPCKQAYVGAPVRSYAHACDYCNGNDCTCGTDGCTCGSCNNICEAVVDDAAGVVYLYGNVKHEDYHVPQQNCIAYTGVLSAGFPYTGTIKADEIYDGEQDNNNITFKHMPMEGSLEVYLNGLRQTEGMERDYQRLADDKIHFNFYNLLADDKVEVIYHYLNEEK